MREEAFIALASQVHETVIGLVRHHARKTSPDVRRTLDRPLAVFAMKPDRAAPQSDVTASAPSWLARVARYFGAHLVANKDVQERDRALQRGVVCLCLTTWWIVLALRGHPAHPDTWFVVVCVAYGAVAFVYRRVVRLHGSVGALYAFLVLDPFFLIGVLVQDPLRFAFLHPFLLVVVVRTGIRYGVRTMYLSLGATLLASTALLSSNYWRENAELAQAFVLMLAFVPLFFPSLIRRIHRVRAIEAERARADAVHELAVARNLFLARVSHELRSPLQSIVSALDVIEMRQRQISPDDQEVIGGMRRSSLLLNTQLRDLLTLTKSEAGRLQMHPEPFDAVELIAATMSSLAALAKAKELALVADVPPGPLFVVADAARIDQVLTNLVMNSIRYTEYGQVRVSMRVVGLPATTLRFLVADTGPGIAQDALPTLFEPDRVLTSPVRRGEGSGIGLAIVRTLVEHLEGNISVASTVEEGTTFTVDIPVAQVDAESSRGGGKKFPVVDEPDELRETRN